MSTDTTTLNKGDLVMTDWGLAFVESYTKGKSTVLVKLVNSGTIMSIFLVEAKKATRQQVEEWASRNGWVLNHFENWIKDDDWFTYYIPKANLSGYSVKSETIYPKNFDTAPAMQAEAILLARMLNATKQ